ncbi:hypothetical protein L1987_15116 [Smallanthus sonchifolius]|uniref:Uncharacterized protein n=1 Tax=Smallanthus sonchifolius TaxID=185202 RepID=A0ACB9J5H7_9ASTR|nr:hypothetical protein L1987_15116 [Smallanthus sonchifolius]
MHNLFITILIAVFLCKSSVESLSGGWKSIPNLSDPTVVDIGRFAVDEHNKEFYAALTFGQVVKGESQVVEGVNYNLTITAVDGSAENSYVALVWDKPWDQSRQLVFFTGPI